MFRKKNILISINKDGMQFMCDRKIIFMRDLVDRRQKKSCFANFYRYG